MRNIALVGMLLLAGVAHAGQIAYSYRQGSEGGAAVLTVDTENGKIADHRTLFSNADCRKAKKVRFTDSGALVALTSARNKTPNLFICPAAGGGVFAVDLPGEPDELRAAGESFVVSCEGGKVALVDAASGVVAQVWDGRKRMRPPGYNPEDVCVLPDRKTAVVSYESENVLVFLGLPELKLVSQVSLPKTWPESQPAGPTPEIVLVSPAANTVLATLDRYGAVGLLDLDTALKGEPGDYAYISTALDESLGTAFPDRADRFAVRGREYALVTNSGKAGGAVLVDMAGRTVVRRWDVPHGLEKPIYLGKMQMAVATPAGKLKNGGRTYVPGDSIYLFDLSGEDLTQAGVEAVPLGMKAFYVTAIEADESPLVVIAAGESSPTELLLFDVVRKEILDRQPAKGTIRRLDTAAD